jgi:inhibitor of cysteine peptidase
MILVKIRLLMAVAMLVSSAVLGCTFPSRNPPSTNTLQVPMDDVLKQSVITQSITLAVGNTLTVKLGSNYSTPYRWTADAKIGDPDVVKQTSHEYLRPSSRSIGAPGTEVWKFGALKAGTTTISTNYASFVGSNTTPVCTFTANVTVQ